MKMTREERYENRQRLKREREEAEIAENKRKEAAQQKEDIRFMRQAITQARRGEKIGEVPIGCVIVCDGKVIGRGYNRRNTDKSTLSHAEITAIRKASKEFGDWRLENCTLYVTLEPCQMCAGAIVQARVKRVVYACANPKAGCAGSIINLLNMREFNHRVEVTTGVCEEECSRMLTGFFERLRTEKGKKEAETQDN